MTRMTRMYEYWVSGLDRFWLQLLALFILLGADALAQQPGFNWSVQIGNGSDQRIQSIALGIEHEVVSAGYFQNNLDFDPSDSTYMMQPNNYASSPFIFSLSPNGSFEWASFVDVLYGSQVSTSDNDGYHYLSGKFGCFEGDIDPGLGEIIIEAINDVLIVKFTQLGEIIWAKVLGDGLSWDQQASDIEVDSYGNVYTCGFFGGEPDFDPGPDTLILDQANGSAFIHKMDSDGNLVWAKQVATAYPDSWAEGISLDDENSLYVTGEFRDTVDFDPGPDTFMLASAGTWDAFVLKLNSDGEFQWARRFGGPFNDYGRFIESMPDGTVWVGGEFRDSAFLSPSLTPVQLESISADDLFILKLDTDGEAAQYAGIGAGSGDELYEMSLDLYGNLYISTSHTGTADLDPGPGTTLRTGNNLTKLDPNLNLIWTVPLTAASGIAVDSAQNVHVCGSFTGSVDLNPSPTEDSIFTSNGNSDVFVLKLNQDSLLTTHQPITSIGEMEVSVYPNPSNGNFSVTLSERFRSIQATVLDLAGRAVHSQTVFNSTSFNINLEGESGLYLLEMTTDDGRAAVRLVKE